ncbi:MAG TPA: hypothetical protein VGD56_16775, partial [Gemmatirosa sp.]
MSAGAAGPSDAPRYVTVFNGARDGYQVPLALAESGRLETLITDWYTPLDRGAVAAVLGLAPGRVRAFLARRHHPSLPSRRVQTMPWQAVLQRRGPRALADADARLGRRAGERARRCGAGVLAYNYYAHAAFTAFGSAPGPRVLFQVQAHPAALRRVLGEARALAADDDARAS